jgi:hypothetical protein
MARKLRRGWCYGEKVFRQELLDQMAGAASEPHYAEEWFESDEQKARRIVAVELKRLRWAPEELKRRRKGGSKEGADREAVKAGDGDDAKVGGRRVAHGSLDACVRSGIPAGTAKAMKLLPRSVSTFRTDPFMTRLPLGLTRL